MTRTIITLSHNDILTARKVVKQMKARSIRPRPETLMIANSIPGDKIEV